MSTTSFTIFILANVWLLVATTSIAQFVIDTSGEPVENDDDYFIRPAITGNGGRFTLVVRNACPLNVGIENTDVPHGFAVLFSPFVPDHEHDEVRLDRDLRVIFQAVTDCAQSTEWRLGERDATSGRRFIVTGRDNGTVGSYGNFFRIVQTPTRGIFNIQWCPTEVCPNCKFECGTVGIVRENDKILLALDGGALPVVFQKE